MSRDFFKDVVVLSSLGAYVEPYGLATFPQWKTYDRYGLFHIAYGKSTNVRFWSIILPTCLRYPTVPCNSCEWKRLRSNWPFISLYLSDDELGTLRWASWFHWLCASQRKTDKQATTSRSSWVLDITSEARDDTTRDAHWRVWSPHVFDIGNTSQNSRF